MTTLNISLPDALREFVEARVAEGAYNTADDYLRALVREDQRRNAQERLDALLREGVESGPSTPMTAQDWESVRAEVRRRGEAKAHQALLHE